MDGSGLEPDAQVLVDSSGEGATTRPPPQATPALSAKRSVTFLAGSLAGGNLVAMALRLIGGVLLGRLVAPSTLGLFAGIGLALGYAPLLQLGILNGLNRELPYFVGKGDRERVRELAAAAQAWALLVGAAVFVALTGVAVWQLAEGDVWKAAGWFTNALLALILFYSTLYLQMTFRSAHDFAKLAWVNVVDGIVATAGIALVALWSFYGLCLRVLLAGAVGTLLLHLWRPVRVGPKWNLGHLRHLLIIGAPIFGVGQLYGWWGGVINSTLVLKFTGTKGMGLFSMVLVGMAAVEVVPLAVSQVVYPRMAEERGRGCTIGDLVQIARKPILLTAGGLLVVIVIGWLLVEPLMRLVIPAYVDGASAMRWALCLAFVTCFQPISAVFNVVRRQDLYVAAILLGIVVYGGSLLLLLRGGVYLAAFPQAMLIGRLVYTMAAYTFVLRLRKSEQSRSAR